ncbi:MAG: DEAD/DEAH box helicase [Bacteroidales bacterium]
MSIQEIISAGKEKIADSLDKQEMAMGEIIFNSGCCQVLSQSPSGFELIITSEEHRKSAEYKLETGPDGTIFPMTDNERTGWDRYSYACLLQVENDLRPADVKEQILHKKYTREGMKNRVLKERRLKADKADYFIKWAENIYGDHVLTNENGIRYKIFLRDFDNETGYSDSADARLNKLGTTKHIMYAFRKLKENPGLFDKLARTCPFVEIYCDPLNDYAISWFYPHPLPPDAKLFISRFFRGSDHITVMDPMKLLNLIIEAKEIPCIRIRPEVIEKIELAYEKKALNDLSKIQTPDFSLLKPGLYPYQEEGIRFALFRKEAVIADEMGLGKTLQAIGTAVLKKEIFGFTRTLVVCPATLKEQWKKEIENFSGEKAVIVSGTPDERELIYNSTGCFFCIVNYETVLRDHQAINRAGFDFLILDEAQRAKNYETLTVSALKRLDVKHRLALTGTPIENHLIDIFSIMSVLNPAFLGPLWEFSYQHCLFDPEKPNKINGYYNLQKLNKKLSDVLIRREKRNVMKQLPNIRQITIPVNLSPMQAEYHASYAKGLAQIIRKKFLTPYDLKKLQLILANMRMVCDSTYLIDETTNESPKLEELRYVLFEKMDIQNKNMKIIIFSEWIKVHQLIGRMLRENNVGFVELNGKVPVKSRGELIKKFENNPGYKVFLSTEAGGTGLNLQVADTLINFELPWNPARKNQRTGRIDRIGQRSSILTIFNLITRNSIEEQIASGLLVKQSLFDGVLGGNNDINFVDFSTRGRSQFIRQLEEFITITERQASETLLQQPAATETAETEVNTSMTREIDPGVEMTETREEQQPAVTAVSEARSEELTGQLESVMNSGMQFLAGLFKMSTGKDMGIENQKIEVNRETGEVVMKFKLPV